MKRLKDYIIFALDVPSFEEARGFVRLLSSHVGMFKVGLELFVRCGPDVVKMIRTEGDAGIFLDLKLHDIPATVSRAMTAVAELGVDLTTVHCAESTDMLKAAVAASAGRTKVLGVTLLTSISGKDIGEAGYSPEFATDPARLILKKAAMAKAAGLSGVVCAGQEAGMIKNTFGKDFLAITPGVRPADDAVSGDDQKRIATPAAAIKNGADYLVIGRPIRDADDPVTKVARIIEEIRNTLSL